MKNLKHVLSVTLAVLAVLFLTGCWQKDHPVRTSLNVDTSTLTLAVGESATRTATTKAQWDYQITYTSSNPAVATVDQTGKVTAVSEGEAVITVSMAETIKCWYAAATRSYNVVVKKTSSDDDGGATPAPAPVPVVAVTGVAISGDAAINAGSSYTGQLTATVTPATATDPSVTWTSSHPGILAVDANGNVSLVALPASTTNVTITATSNSNPAVSDSKVINVLSMMANNPLWWVAQYNLASDKASFVASHSTTSQYCFNFNDAKVASVTISGTTYHQPSFSEQVSVIPYDESKSTGSGSNIFSWTEALDNPREFAEKACTVGGASVASTTSIWGKRYDKDYYAIRFIGTPYCSAWHYKWVGSPCNGLLIESYLLSGVTTLNEAKTKMAEAGFISTTFTGTANAGTANQTPTSSTLTTNGFCQRFLPACGCKGGSSGVADSDQGIYGHYWSSTADGSNGFFWRFNSTGYLYELSDSQSYGFSVRLFRDH